MNKLSKILHRRGKALSALTLSLIMTSSLGCSSMLKSREANPDTETVKAIESGVTFEDVTGKVNLDSVVLNNLSPKAIKGVADTKADTLSEEVVIVSLAGDSLIDGAPDNLSVGDYLKTAAGKAHAREISDEHRALFKELDALKISYKVEYEYSAVLNAVAIEVNSAYAAAIKAIDGVTSVVGSNRYNAPETQAAYVTNGSVDEIYTTGIYDSSEFVADGYTGRNIAVAILDTGIDYTHEAFDMEIADGDAKFTRADIDRKIATQGSEFNASKLLAQSGSTLRSNDVYVSSKVPFAFDYADRDTDVYPSYSQHGVHVAGIVGGKADSYTDKNGEVVVDDEGDPVPFSGVAPGAQLVICKVFTDDTESADIGGAVTEDLIAALEDCVLLGVDIINMSLGTSCGFSQIEIDGDTEGLMLSRCYDSIDKAGINLIAAASNDFSSGYGGNFGTNLASNPDSGTVGSPSTFTAALSVASINGQLAPYVVANSSDTSKGSIIYFENSSDANSVQYDFVGDVLDGAQTKTYPYVIVPGYGRTSDYSAAVQSVINSYKDRNEPIAVVVKRGYSTFQEKVEIAMEMGADAIVVYNNVTGRIRMTLGEVEDPIPAISVSMDAGKELEDGSTSQSGVKVGKIVIDSSYKAGPFMNDYSSWGVTPDLKLKPEVTIYGGEIISSVSGGYQEMSGTSMATPSMAGLVAVAMDYLKHHENEYSNLSVLSESEKAGGYAEFVNQLAMSTGTIVNDDNDLPVSPRKQGAGLVSLVNMLASKVYLSNSEVAKNRPKAELGDDKDRTGVYSFTFELNNISGAQKSYKISNKFFTETLSLDGLTVAEKAYLLNNNAEYEINGETKRDGDNVTFGTGTTQIKVTLKLTDDEKAYIDRSFENGMYIEGFIVLEAIAEGECDLSLPFVGYYGDWENPDMPLLDMDAYTADEYEKDPQYNDDNRPKPSVWGTQAYGRYYGGSYTIPLGSYLYLQDEDAEQIYTEKDHVALSCFNEYDVDNPSGDYATAYAIRGLYAGLLRNAELCVYTVTDANTGEVVLEREKHRVNKAYSGGGSTVPGFIEMNLSPSELGLASNGKYTIDFQFYFKAADRAEGIIAKDSSFSMTFYVDYEAPILEDAKLRYYNYRENEIDKQRTYLDLYVYDNHYSQAILLCYAETDNLTDVTQLKLATEYVTPVYNAVKNGTTLVSIDVTDIVENYGGRLYARIDDYALNNTIYSLNLNTAQVALAPADYKLAAGEENITLRVGEAHKVALEYEGDADLSNFFWTSSAQRFVQVKNGEIVGIAPGTATVTVSNKSKDNEGEVAKEYTIRVIVTDESYTGTSLREISFGTVLAADTPMKASGFIEVYAGQKFTLEIKTEPWYFDMDAAGYTVHFESTNPNYATVDDYGNVIVNDYEWDENGKVTFDPTGHTSISAVVYRKVTDAATGEVREVATSIFTEVSLIVRDTFRVSNMTLTGYYGTAKEIWIPDDRNIMTIGDQAFNDNLDVEIIHVPKTVQTISERAFEGCENLREVIFEDSDSSDDIHDSSLNMIYRFAFANLPKLEVVDFTNCRSVTVSRQAFQGCTALKEVKGSDRLTTLGYFAFAGCTSLEYIDISNLHTCGFGAFYNCTALERITTANFTEIGDFAFYGCSSLMETGADATSPADSTFIINGAYVGESAFENNLAIRSVTFTNPRTVIADRAFYNSFWLESVNFAEGSGVVSIGVDAFSRCDGLSSVTVPNADAEIGENDCEILGGTLVYDYRTDAVGNRYSYDGKTLISVSAAATTVDLTGVTTIAGYAFANARNLTSLVVPANVIAIDERAFYRSSLINCDLSATSLKAIPTYAFAGSSRLSSVTLPSTVTEIGIAAFDSCSALNSFDFANITALGEYSFAGAGLTSLTVPANLTEIADWAFSYTQIGTVNFTGISKIGSYAFAYSDVATINLAGVTEIGEGAFYSTNLQTVEIPATVEKIGQGAFANNTNLTEITVAEGNKKFFIGSGALYRIISEGKYELLSYPGALLADGRKFTVLDGTVSIASSAFEGLVQGAIAEMHVAYSVKVIGEAAFFNSRITTYYFYAIEAPTLLSQVSNEVLRQLVTSTSLTYRGMFYNNFQEYLYPHVGDVHGDYAANTSNLRMYYPSNGVNYDNYIFTHYFGTRTPLGVLIDDTTRTVKTALEGLAEKIALVKSWQESGFATTDENKALVEALVGEISALHASYLTITDETQQSFLSDELVAGLTEIEAELRAVKEKFGISSQIVSFNFVEGSAKTAYRAGEMLDLTGLRLTINYSDYSTEEVTLSDGDYTFGLFSAKPGTPLTIYDNTVEIIYKNVSAYIMITVTEEGTETPPPGGNTGDGPGDDNPGDDNSSLGLIIGLSVGGGVLVLAAAGVVVYFLVFKKKGTKVDSETEKEDGGNENA